MTDKRTTMWIWAAALVAAAIPLLIAGCGGGGGGSAVPSSGDPLATTTAGVVVGTNDTANGVQSFKGIPYAAPPVGNLRWKPPQDPAAWTTPRTAQSFGNACSQYGRIYGPGSNNKYDATIGTTLGTAVGSEDCLYLNVWKPATGKNLPVVVFFHGGSNVSGYTADPMYEGTNLAKNANVVVVTPNFRLGVFGFFNQASLKNGDAANDSGNYALLDSIKALQWVRANIAAFGGNPDNVTIMGQSAGAINVWALQASPLMVAANPKLFHKVMPLSGGISMSTNLPDGSIPTLNGVGASLSQSFNLFSNLIVADGLAPDTAAATVYIAGLTTDQKAAYLRSKTPAQIFTVLLTKMPLQAGSGPIPDGAVLAADPIAAIAAGNYVQVPVLAGNTRDEGKLFPSFLPLVGGAPPSARLVTDGQLFANHFSYNPNAAPATTIDQWIAPSYLPVNAPVSGFTARAELLNSVFFLRSRDNVLNTLKTKQNNVYYYRFDWDKQPAPWNDIYGAVHVVDLPFIFGNFGPSLFGNVWFSEANKPGRLELSAAMMSTVSAFARTGDPNNAALGATWAAWPAKMVFDASATAKSIHAE